MRVGVVWTFFRSSVFFCIFPSSGDGPIWTEILSQRTVKPKTTNPLNPPVLSDMRTPVYSCYYNYSKVSDKNACRSWDSGLTILFLRFWIQFRRFVVVWNLQNGFPADRSLRENWLYFSSFFSTALSVSFKFHPAFSLLAFCEQTMLWSQKRLTLTPSCFFSNGTFDVIM